jgi:predicted ATPase
MNKIKRVVLSGGPCSGKSTMVSELAELGFPVAKEAALSVIEDLNQEMGIEAQIKYRSEHIHEFQNKIYEKQVQLEHDAVIEAAKYKNPFVICDRGVYDGLTYYKLFDKEADPSLKEKIEKHTYDYVFICEVLPDFDIRSETGRFEDVEMSKKLSQLSYDIYSEKKDNVIWLPAISIEDRLNFIIDYLE